MKKKILIIISAIVLVLTLVTGILWYMNQSVDKETGRQDTQQDDSTSNTPNKDDDSQVSVGDGEVIELKLNIKRDGKEKVSFLFLAIAELGYEIKEGDVIEYDVMMEKAMHGMGHIDASFTDGTYLRDCAVLDQEGNTCHPMGDIGYYAGGEWYHRSMMVGNKCAGKTIDTLQLAAHPDADAYTEYEDGIYTVWYDNIRITNNGKEVLTIFANETDLKDLPVRMISNAGMTGELSLVWFQEGEKDETKKGKKIEIATASEGVVDAQGGNSDITGDVLKLNLKVNKDEGSNLSYLFLALKKTGYKIQKGDAIEYDVMLKEDIHGMGHIDATFTDSTHMRDYGVIDGTGANCHPMGDLSDFATGRWYHRSMQVGEKCAGKTIDTFELAAHPDASVYSAYENSVYTIWYDNIRITNNGKTVFTIFADAKDTEKFDCTVAGNKDISASLYLISDNKENVIPISIGKDAQKEVAFSSGHLYKGTVSDTLEGDVLKLDLDVTTSAEASFCHLFLNIASIYYEIEPGDAIEYDVVLEKQLTGIGHVDGNLPKTSLRDCEVFDQEGRNIHPSGDLSSVAYGNVYHRSEMIGNACAGSVITELQLAAHPGAGTYEMGVYTVLYDNIRITNNGETKLVIFADKADYKNLDIEYNDIPRGMSADICVYNKDTQEISGLLTFETQFEGAVLEMTLDIDKSASATSASVQLPIAMLNYNVRPGDAIEYDVYLEEDMHGVGSVNAYVKEKKNYLSIVKIKNSEGNYSCHSKADLSEQAYAKTYHRRIVIGEDIPNYELTYFYLSVAPEVSTAEFENGTYTVWFDNIRITNQNETVVNIFSDAEDFETLTNTYAAGKGATASLSLGAVEDGTFVSSKTTTMEGASLEMKYEVTKETDLGYHFLTITAPNYVIQKGDVIEYDVMLDEDMPGFGHMDGILTSNGTIRDSAILDSEGVNCHPLGDISSESYGKSYHREILIGDKVAGDTLAAIQLAAHPQARDNETVPMGVYKVWYDNVRITNGGETKLLIFADVDDYSKLTVVEGNKKDMTGTLSLANWEKTYKVDGAAIQMEFKVTEETSTAYNFFTIATSDYVVQEGDVIEYTVMLKENMNGLGHVDGELSNDVGKKTVRSGPVYDSNGMNCHPSGNLSSYAYGCSYNRTMYIGDSLAGYTLNELQLAAHPSAGSGNTVPLGTYTVWYDNIRITNNGEVQKVIFYDENDYANLNQIQKQTKCMTASMSLVEFKDGSYIGNIYRMDGGVIRMDYTVTETSTSNNVYHYFITSYPEYVIEAGDILEYDVMISADASGYGSICGRVKDADGTTENWIRSCKVKDERGKDCVPWVDVSDYAYNQEYHRAMHIGDTLEGDTISYLQLAAQPNTSAVVGDYTVWYDNIRITNNGVTKLEIFKDAEDYSKLTLKEGIKNKMTGKVSLCHFADGQEEKVDGSALQVTYDVSSTETPSYYYLTLNSTNYVIQKGDVIEYDVVLLNDVRGFGHVDGRVNDGTSEANWIRSYRVKDNNSTEYFPTGDLSDYAYGKSYHRALFIGDKLEGETLSYLQLAAQPNGSAAVGTYTVLYDNIRITNNGETKLHVFTDAEDYESLSKTTGLKKYMNAVISLVNVREGQMVE